MAKDILIDEIFKDGDFNIGHSDEQHIEHILLAQKGDYKQHPLLGVGIIDYLNGPRTLKERLKIEKQIKVQLEYDKATDIKISTENDTIGVVAKYT